MGTTCAAPDDSAGTCGIPAIGRCGTCGGAFCLTHQARVGDGGHKPGSESRYLLGTSYPDWCRACRARELVEPAIRTAAAIQATRDAEAQALRDRIRAGTTLALAQFGALSVRRTATSYELVKGVFGRGKLRDVTSDLPAAIALGDLSWRFVGWVPWDGSVDRVEKRPSGMTRDGQVVLMDRGKEDGLTFVGSCEVADAVWAVLDKNGMHEPR